MLNLIFFSSGIPSEIGLIDIAIIGDFSFTNEVHVDTGNQILASYAMDISFDPEVAIINTEEGNNGISAGPEGFVTAVDTSEQGIVSVSGFDASGTGPSSDLHLYTIHWLAQTYNGSTELTMEIESLSDDESNWTGTPSAETGTITIETITCVLGDINYDNSIDIVDALVAAQYFVGLNPNIDINCGDVNCDGRIDIIDALLIAQYFVGLISEFC
jgi:hypothetical protein